MTAVRSVTYAGNLAARLHTTVVAYAMGTIALRRPNESNANKLPNMQIRQIKIKKKLTLFMVI